MSSPTTGLAEPVSGATGISGAGSIASASFFLLQPLKQPLVVESTSAASASLFIRLPYHGSSRCAITGA
jgi:hypothetical protein